MSAGRIPSYRTHNFVEIDTEGTEPQGQLQAPIEELRALFGNPIPGAGPRSTYEWRVLFEDYLIVTIYDYGGIRWCVGGHVKEAFSRIERLLNLHRSVKQQVA